MMIHKVPLELIIEEEKKKRSIEEGRRAYLELPLPERQPELNDKKDSESSEVVIHYGEVEDDEAQDRGVTIISIFGD